MAFATTNAPRAAPVATRAPGVSGLLAVARARPLAGQASRRAAPVAAPAIVARRSSSTSSSSLRVPASSSPRARLVRAYAAAAPSSSSSSSSPASALTSGAAGAVVHLYRQPLASPAALKSLAERASRALGRPIASVSAESCFNVGLLRPLSASEADKLAWLLRETFEPELLRADSALSSSSSIVEVGPRLSFTTPWATNVASICASTGLSAAVERVEASRRYEVSVPAGSEPLSPSELAAFASLVHDRMTEQVYETPLASFSALEHAPTPVRRIPVMAEGRKALEAANAELGLAFDSWDLDHYTSLFRDTLGRDPSDVELFDLAQSNSEHSRHWFFRGDLVVDGAPTGETLMQVVKSTLAASPHNSVVAFADNSSAVRGAPSPVTRPATPGAPGPLGPAEVDLDVLLTAETHNFPCAVAPRPGAETGAGGRMRDTHATGRGSIMGAATAGYCVGNLRLDQPGALPVQEDEEGSNASPFSSASSSSPSSSFPPPPNAHESRAFAYPPTLAHPRDVLTESSNGASDYGNKFGEPLIAGFTRSFGLRTPEGARREWIKPIMFSGGLGAIDHSMLAKDDPELGWHVVKLGGPAYRIGMGGGAASSLPAGALSADLDFDAVQRGDAEMSQKLWRVVRACVELGERNPLRSIHDQGAGGNCNVVKEIIYPLGAEIRVRDVALGDRSMSVLEIWGAEYQENDCVLVAPKDLPTLLALAARERCGACVIGEIDGSGKVVLRDAAAPADEPAPVDLDLELVLGDMPRKRYDLSRRNVGKRGRALELANALDAEEGGVGSPGAGPLTARSALSSVLALPSVCSKRFLTNKVDRCVTGLVAQQQSVGPLATPLADAGVLAASHWDVRGAATAIGEQPIKGLLSPTRMARLALAESLTNLVWAPVTALGDVKSSVNWMYDARADGEGADIWDAADALRDAMIQLKVAVDGGKDSLSMSAAADGEQVVAPGNLVVSAYAACPDVTKAVTPDLKVPAARGERAAPPSALVFVDLAGVEGKAPAPGAPAPRRLGGSAFAQSLGQLGDEAPDADVAALGAAFEVTQRLLDARKVLAGHDVSDGGLVVAALEMAFAGARSNLDLDLASGTGTQENERNATQDSSSSPPLTLSDAAALFAEEPGLLLQVEASLVEEVEAAYAAAGVRASRVGSAAPASSPAAARARVAVSGRVLIDESVSALRAEWEATSWALEARQCAAPAVAQERAAVEAARVPVWNVPFGFDGPQGAPEVRDALASSAAAASSAAPPAARRPKVAVVREEGTNGDREMASALLAAGMAPWDVTMSDLAANRVDLADFQGLVFPGGFSYADVLDSAKGWAGAAKFDERLWKQLEAFRARKDTFSLGVCNGCQLMALLGWVPGKEAMHENERGDAKDASASSFALPDVRQPRFVHNASGRFECRWSTVQVDESSPSIWLRGMGGATLGVWVAHGEGRAHFPDPDVKARILDAHLAPLRYVAPEGNATTEYPYNPNGSEDAVAALCSPDGRHLALMPHPERCYLAWQCPWVPDNVQLQPDGASPWIRMFQNARDWANNVREE